MKCSVITVRSSGKYSVNTFEMLLHMAIVFVHLRIPELLSSESDSQYGRLRLAIPLCQQLFSFSHQQSGWETSLVTSSTLYPYHTGDTEKKDRPPHSARAKVDPLITVSHHNDNQTIRITEIIRQIFMNYQKWTESSLTVTRLAR